MEPGVMIDMFMKKGFLETEEIRGLDQIKEIKEYTGIMSENWAKVDTLVNFQITYNWIFLEITLQKLEQNTIHIFYTDKNGC